MLSIHWDLWYVAMRPCVKCDRHTFSVVVRIDIDPRCAKWDLYLLCMWWNQTQEVDDKDQKLEYSCVQRKPMALWRMQWLEWSQKSSLLSWVCSGGQMICSDNIVCRENSMQTDSGNLLDWFDRGWNEYSCPRGVCKLREVQCIYIKYQHWISNQSWCL